MVIAAGGWSGELLQGLGHKDVQTNIQTWTCPNFDIKGVEGLTMEDKPPFPLVFKARQEPIEARDFDLKSIFANVSTLS